MSKAKILAVEVIAPVLAFLGLYIAGTLALGALLQPLFASQDMYRFAWASFGAAAIANLVCVALFDRFTLRLGLLEPLARIGSGLGKGTLVALTLIGGSNAVILATTSFEHAPGAGIDWIEVLALFLPAAIHEELVFRGYLLQKPARLNLAASILATSVLFAMVHGGNPSVGPIALLNIFLAGILLGLAWAWRRNLWIPIAIHVVWNVVSGPVLGHEVSGLSLPKTLLKTVDPGPALLTGGPFGIEASVYLTLGELLVIAFLIWRIAVLRALAAPVTATEVLPVPAPITEGSAEGDAPVSANDIARTNETES